MKNLKEILEQHALWLTGEGGPCTNLSNANLRGANLCDANLRGANLRGANLRDANLCGANLRGANLRDANLSNAILSNANLCGANLRGANLCDANLRGAILRGANLWATKGNRSEVKSVQVETFDVTYTAKVMQIGCKRYTFDEWWAFPDDGIEAMDSEALSFWHKWKDTLKQIVEMSPATPTGKE